MYVIVPIEIPVSSTVTVHCIVINAFRHRYYGQYRYQLIMSAKKDLRRIRKAIESFQLSMNHICDLLTSNLVQKLLDIDLLDTSDDDTSDSDDPSSESHESSESDSSTESNESERYIPAAATVEIPIKHETIVLQDEEVAVQRYIKRNYQMIR